MKFLVLAKFRVDALWRPGEQEPPNFQEDLQGGYGGFSGLFEPGFFEFIYGRIDGGWVGIANVKSHRELWQKLTVDKTLYSLFEWHIEPLIDDNVIAYEEDRSINEENLRTVFPDFMSQGEWDK